MYSCSYIFAVVEKSLDVEFQQLNWSVFIVSVLIVTNAHFNIIICAVREIHTEPRWGVGTSAACSFTLQAIPERVIREKWVEGIVVGSIIGRLAVIVVSNK